MFPQAIQDLLSQPNHAIVAVDRPSGGPQVTPVWYLWDGEAFYFSTTKDRAKYSNIKRNPSISLIVDNSQGFGYVAAYGQAHFITHDDPDFAPLTSRLVAKYVSPEQLEQTVQSSLASDRIIIKLLPEKIVGPTRND